MTEAMPFLRKLILLSYDPRPWPRGFLRAPGVHSQFISRAPVLTLLGEDCRSDGVTPPDPAG